MKTYRIVVCANEETIRPWDIDESIRIEFNDSVRDIIDDVIRNNDRDARIYIDTDDSFQKWNGGKFSDQRVLFGWNAGTNLVVTETNAPKYVRQICEKVDKELRYAIDKLVADLSELALVSEQEEE